VLFAANAPEGKTMVRLRVDMIQAAPVDPSGVSISGSVGATIRTGNLYRGSVYEAISYVIPGTYDYRFYNGLVSETVPGLCSVNGSREVTVNIDTVIPVVCFSYCIACGTGISGLQNEAFVFSAYPNPASGTFLIKANKTPDVSFRLTDVLGNTVREYVIGAEQEETYSLNGLPPGVYFLNAVSSSGKAFVPEKLVVQ